MAMRSRFTGMSAQQVDPLSWFIGPYVPMSFSVLSLIYGVTGIAATWSAGGLPWLQPVALLLCAGAGVAVHVATRPFQRELGWPLAALALAVSACGLVLSAIGYRGTDLDLSLWWGSGALALTIASLGPYLPVRQLLAIGMPITSAAVVIAVAILYPISHWGPLATALLVAYSSAAALAATSVFSYSIVSQTLPLLESPSRILVPGQRVRDEVAQQLEEVEVARLTARAAPFLQRIAEAGRISAVDRALAGQLARRMRDDLVTQSNLTWLDSVAAGSRLVVVDPDRRARQMNAAQRTALRAMLRAILDRPGTDSGSLMIELREAPDGATAVAISLDVALPEGRRILHLAPYYLTLETAVDDLRVELEGTLLSFRVP